MNPKAKVSAYARLCWAWYHYRGLIALVLLLAALTAVSLLRVRADRSVTLRIPNYDITINGQQPDNRSAAYPLLTHDGVTYLPATAADCLGLRVDQTDDGIAVTVTGSAASYHPAVKNVPNPTRVGAAVLDCPITVAGEPYDNADADAPFLQYHGVPYLPLTEALCTGPFCLDYQESESRGLTLTTTGRLRAETDALPHFILHMGGLTDTGESDTNSIEAADASYEAGYRWLELDFNWTSDGALVCIHDWGNWWHRMGITSRQALSLADFEQRDNGIGDYHSFTPEKLSAWLEAHPGAMIVTDVKENNVAAMTWLAEHYPDLRSRLIVQIYDFDEYEPVEALGYPNIILTMYKISWQDYHDLKKLGEFIRTSSILAVTMAADDSVRDVFDYLTATGIPVYVHTLNNPKAQTLWMVAGAYGVYTNYGDVRGTPDPEGSQP